tara:strand:- start:79 stop:414 length:336 start_codon:yes stop_codon:yes gene_type:complete
MRTNINEELTIASVALQRDRNIHCVTTQEMCKSTLYILDCLMDLKQNYEIGVLRSTISNEIPNFNDNLTHSIKRTISRIKALELEGVIKLNTSETSLLDNLCYNMMCNEES